MSYKNKKWLYNQYHNLRKSYENIGIKCNVSKVTIGNWIRRFGFEVRSVRENQLGKKHSEESKRKISIIQKEIGKKEYIKEIRRQSMLNNWKNKEFRARNLQRCKKQINEKSPVWKGNKAGKGAFHRYIEKYKKKPKKCKICNKLKKLELSFNHLKENYTRNFEDYEWLCHSCHIKKEYKMGFRKPNHKKHKKHWWDNINKLNADNHLESIEKKNHIRTYFRHLKKLRELGFIEKNRRKYL